MATKSKASGISFHVEGVEDIQRMLRDLPHNIQRSGINSAARLAAKPIIAESRVLVEKVSKGTDQGFSKAAYVSRSIKSVTNKTKSVPGVTVRAKGGSVPVRGSRNGNWNVGGYLKLLASGSYKTPERKGRGKFEGYGNFIQIAARKVRNEASGIFRRNLVIATKKAVDRARKKHIKTFG